MIALSIRQPWAWLIFNAGKDIENRTWRTRVRGRVLIHAAAGMTRHEFEMALLACHIISDSHPSPAGLTLPAPDELERGGFIGSVEIVDCVTESASPWFFGPYGFVLASPIPQAFRPYKASLGFFNVAEESAQ